MKRRIISKILTLFVLACGLVFVTTSERVSATVLGDCYTGNSNCTNICQYKYDHCKFYAPNDPTCDANRQTCLSKCDGTKFSCLSNEWAKKVLNEEGREVAPPDLPALYDQEYWCKQSCGNCYISIGGDEVDIDSYGECLEYQAACYAGCEL